MNLNNYLLDCCYAHKQFHFSKAFMGTITVKGGIIGHILEQVWWYIPGTEVISLIAAS